MPRHNEAMRCRHKAPETKRCAVGQNKTMRCRFARSSRIWDSRGTMSNRLAGHAVFEELVDVRAVHQPTEESGQLSGVCLVRYIVGPVGPKIDRDRFDVSEQMAALICETGRNGSALKDFNFQALPGCQGHRIKTTFALFVRGVDLVKGPAKAALGEGNANPEVMDAGPQPVATICQPF